MSPEALIMDAETATEPPGTSGQRPPRDLAGTRRRRRWITAAFLVALAIAAGAVALRRSRPADRFAARPAGHRVATGWAAAPVPLPAVATELEGNVGRLLAREASVLGAASSRAGRVPNLAGLLASSIDGAGFQDALSTEPWWKDFRSYGCAVLAGDEVRAVWQLPGSGLPPAELARAVGAAPSPSAGAARLVTGPNGIVLGALAPIDGVKDGRVLLVEAVDRMQVARLAARANTVMLLSDGKRDLGASVPDPLVPELDGLVGKEGSHVVVERGLGRLAVAVPWSDRLWLWAVVGWEP